ncbi:hypothetical protein [Wansuia hejianensis]|uniref:Uncharacterized protein n=1 Tax=Wansuia hejianensis TaxID=2763667 RepID=A0A926IMH5_9FIRM|nr:hypothetical protein [Wansuia hejianensis]MBC8590626.1 hypothetical protein [Wansuia hejianensis]
MKLRKDDPIYYKLKINGLIVDAFKNGLNLETKIYKDKIGILFKAENGDVAEVILNYKE